MENHPERGAAELDALKTYAGQGGDGANALTAGYNGDGAASVAGFTETPQGAAPGYSLDPGQEHSAPEPIGGDGGHRTQPTPSRE